LADVGTPLFATVPTCIGSIKTLQFSLLLLQVQTQSKCQENPGAAAQNHANTDGGSQVRATNQA
jgi:hypothetical protein